MMARGRTWDFRVCLSASCTFDCMWGVATIYTLGLLGTAHDWCVAEHVLLSKGGAKWSTTLQWPKRSDGKAA